ncbi:MAG: HAD-IIB family hydrolase [Desulfarculus sp.]|nr:HAD-IIB family hydrolase [Desulfarculus sp.]
MRLVVFTDLDGTLLDHQTYSHAAARPALEALKAVGAELVPCSSKTRAELLPLVRELGLDGPLISENGGGVFLPQGHPLASQPGWLPAGPGWLLRPLGLPIAEVRARLATFASRFGARGFGQMTDAEVAQLTGLSLEAAASARQREFDEPVWLPEPERQAEAFLAASRQAGLEATRGGRFFHVLSGADKGRAAGLLLDLYRPTGPQIISAGLGDALNDAPLLAAVDRPFLVARPDGSHAELDLPGLVRVPLAGPAGFNQAILGLLGELGL